MQCIHISIKYFPALPSFSLAEQRPLSVPVILALVSAALLWPSLWLVPPHADTGKTETVTSTRGEEEGRLVFITSSPVSAAGPLPS